MQFKNNLEINRNSLINPVIDPRTGVTPATPVKGQMYYDLDTDDMWYWDGSWVQFGTGGGSVVAVTGSEGIASSGGTSPDLTLAIDTLVETNAIVAADSLLFYDNSNTIHRRRTLSTFITDIDGLINHNNLLNGGGNQHIDHTAVTITAGSGLSYSAGGSNIAASSTIDLNINELTVATIADGDFVPFWDITATATNKKTTYANFVGGIDHSAINDDEPNQHIDHTTITITAGTGLSYSVGGTNIASDSTVNLDFTELSTITAATTTDSDYLAIYDVAGSPGHKSITIAELRTDMQSGLDLTFGIAGTTGSGTVSTSQTLNVVGTANQMESVASGQTITMAFTNNVTMPNNLTVTGDLTVNGTTTTVNTDNLLVQDPLIKMGDGNSADSVDLGVYWEYDNTGAEFGGIYRDASDGNKAITFFESNTTEPTSTVVGGTLADVKFGTVRSGTWNGTAIGDTYISSASTWNGKQDALTFGIANTNSVVIDSASVNTGEYAKFTGSGLESLTAAEMRNGSNLNVDVAGTDNSTDVTLTGTPNYITISGQVITRGLVVLTTDVSGILPRANGGTGINSAPTNGQLLIGNTTGNVWAVATPTAAATTGTGAEGTALTVGTGASALSYSAKYATTTVSGVVSIATNAEVITGSSTLLMVTPSNLDNWAEQSNKTITRKYTTTMTGATNSFDITHGLGVGKEVQVYVYDTGNTYEQIFCDIEHLSTTVVRVIFSENLGADTYQVVVIG